MISFFRFFTSLLAMTTLTVVAQDSATTTNMTDNQQIFSMCGTEVGVIFACLTANGITNATFLDDGLTASCNECFETSSSLDQSDKDLVGKPCEEVALLVDNALVECAPECMLGACTTELTGLMRCLFNTNVPCVDGVLATPPMAAPTATATAPAPQAPLPADDGKSSNTPAASRAFFSHPTSVVASALLATTTAVALIMAVV